jgi:hypothetical protein
MGGLRICFLIRPPMSFSPCLLGAGRVVLCEIAPAERQVLPTSAGPRALLSPSELRDPERVASGLKEMGKQLPRGD